MSQSLRIQQRHLKPVAHGHRLHGHLVRPLQDRRARDRQAVEQHPGGAVLQAGRRRGAGRGAGARRARHADLRRLQERREGGGDCRRQRKGRGGGREEGVGCRGAGQ